MKTEQVIEANKENTLTEEEVKELSQLCRRFKVHALSDITEKNRLAKAYDQLREGRKHRTDLDLFSYRVPGDEHKNFVVVVNNLDLAKSAANQLYKFLNGETT